MPSSYQTGTVGNPQTAINSISPLFQSVIELACLERISLMETQETWDYALDENWSISVNVGFAARYNCLDHLVPSFSAFVTFENSPAATFFIFGDFQSHSPVVDERKFTDWFVSFVAARRTAFELKR